MVQDKAVASPQIASSRSAEREVTKSAVFTIKGQHFGEYRVTSLFGVSCHL